MAHSRYHLPAEWAPQAGVMLTWPHAGGDWADALPAAESVFVTLAREIAARETVLINCYDPDHRHHVQRCLHQAGVNPDSLIFAIAPSNDSWARDHGPLTVIGAAGPRLLDFRFNGWGGKYPAQLDNAISGRLAAAGVFGRTPLTTVDYVLEGGSIDSDGRGTLLTTRRCLLEPHRNPGADAARVEQVLRERLGAQRLLWLDHGALEGDDTDGHIDMLARFCDPATIVYQGCDETAYAGYDELQAMRAQLQSFRTLEGQAYRLAPLPWPRAHYDAQGRRLPASYANFLVINDALLVPAYDDPADALALDTLSRLFPRHTPIAIPCRALIGQYGSLHCATLQFPAGVELCPPQAG